MMAKKPGLSNNIILKTTEMHCCGEPLRIIESGYPKVLGKTILEKRSYCKDNLDHYRKFLMWEPRGHYDMYGALKVDPDHPEADIGVLFMHNEGYSTMCGHAIMCLGRYVVDQGLKKGITPLTPVNIQCPCGLVRALVEYNNGKTGNVMFKSVQAFAYALDYEMEVTGFGVLNFDIGYGGAFYILIPAKAVGLDIRTSKVKDLQEAAGTITDEGRKQITLKHPHHSELAFLYGTIFTDGKDTFSDEGTLNVCVFAERQVDRSPCGSGVTARVAVQYARGLIGLDQSRTFQSLTGGKFTGKAIEKTKCGEFDAVIVEVSGKGNYCGSSTFAAEDNDELKEGFLVV